MSTLAHVLATNSGIDLGYRQKPKQVSPLAPLMLPNAALKWYGVHEASRPIPQAVTEMARQQLATEPLEAPGMGFAILHQCGESFYFLIVGTWRNSNELWQTVLYKDNDAATGFALFPRDAAHKPTLCVWELVPVWHEQQAWTRFLASARDEAAAQNWLRDCYAGSAG
ncbi:MAG: hypothetical protein M3Y54_06620 [Bacteroidota bacterium]|nr:hypothetical protein [Bacteroidota bacterium]